MDISEKVKRCLSKHPDWTTKRISCATGGTYDLIEAVRSGAPVQALTPSPVPAQAPAPERAPAPPTGGFSLRGIRLLSKKPADCMKARLYGLRHGMGYRIDDLSKEWGVSTDTLRKHAKDHKALVYVEATPGEYVACIVHPDTPKGN